MKPKEWLENQKKKKEKTTKEKEHEERVKARLEEIRKRDPFIYE